MAGDDVLPGGYECPRCGNSVGAKDPFRPFCSERCKMVDLGAWWLGHYRVPAVDLGDEAEKGGKIPLDPFRDDDDPAG